MAGSDLVKIYSEIRDAEGLELWGVHTEELNEALSGWLP
jgi:hypothetical protein